MASTTTGRPGRSLLILFVLLFALAAWVVVSGENTPRLGLDLKGGTTVTLEPSPVPGEEGEITDEAISQAVDIISQRVDGSGVAEASVSSQGRGADAVIVVSVPDVGEDELLDQLGQTAILTFRPVLAATSGTPSTAVTPEPNNPDSNQQNNNSNQQNNNSNQQNNNSNQQNNGAVLPRLTEGGSQRVTVPSPPTPAPVPTAPALGPQDVDEELQQQFIELDCSDPEQRNVGQTFKKSETAIACSEDGLEKYILGPVAVDGANIESASPGIPQNGTSWVVNLDFDGDGTRDFGETTTQLASQQPPLNRFAIVLDGVVVSAPSLDSGPILGGQAFIEGSFTQETATELANVLKFGALPLNFEIVERQTISPTLGEDQLKAGLLAGALGLALVVVYLLIYYRALALVAVLSLLIAGLLVYGMVILLGQTIGFTLTLAGVAGLIVAIGITADSFIVYFERIRDEVREGRSLRVALESGWVRAKRTIIAADVISLIAAVVLYVLSVGSVRGFAFTLGLTTIIDLLVVFLFTKPLISLLSRTKFFQSGNKWTGLSPDRLGASKATEQTPVAAQRRAAAKGV